jgi:cytochrome c5
MSTVRRDLGNRQSVLLRLLPLVLLVGCDVSDTRSNESAENGADANVTSVTVQRRTQDPEHGQLLYMGSCSSCHGQRGQGMPHQGVNLRVSSFVARQSDQQLVSFLKRGRAPGDPASVQGLIMPPRGGNPALDDAALSAIVGFLRELQKQAHGDAPPVAQLTRE